jgi:hypothetical protein
MEMEESHAGWFNAHASGETATDNRQPPAQAARDLLKTRDDLTDQPFGKLVSQIARGLDVPPATPDTISDYHAPSKAYPVIAATYAKARRCE